jgi:integrase/recombinase XerC
MPPKAPVRARYAPFADLPPYVREFLHYMLTIRGLSPRTVDGYYLELRTFLRFLKQYRGGAAGIDMDSFSSVSVLDVAVEQICSVTLSDMYAFLEFVSTQRGNAAKARARKVSALSSFYQYLSTKTLYMTENPLKNLDRPAAKKSLPKYLTLEESTRLLDAAVSRSTRDYCILTLFLNCGMRLSELVGINRADIRGDRTLRLLGKGNKERIVYLNDACIDAVSAYLEDTGQLKRADDALFVGRTGKRLSPRRVQQLVEECLKAAGLSGAGYTPHKLRHTAATLMYQHGNVDVRILKEILGHANLATTEIYTHVSSRQMEHAAQRSPLSNRRLAKGKRDAEKPE